VSAVLTTTPLPTAVSLSVIVVRCEGRPNHHTITYSGIAVSYCSAVRAVLTTTPLPTAVSLSVFVVRCEGRPNHHAITYIGIAVSYCGAVWGPS